MENTKSDRDDVLNKVIQLHLVEGRSQADVAKKLEINQTEVSRLIRNARREKLIKLSVPAPANSLAKSLQDHFPSLKKVIIVPTTHDARAALDALGFAAAEFLLERVNTGDRIGISCGNTTRAVARAIETRFFDKRLPQGCKVYPLNAVDENYRDKRAGPEGVPGTVIASTIHPTTLVGAMLSALPGATGELYALTEMNRDAVRRKLETLTDLHHYIVGIGAIDRDGTERSAADTGKSHSFNALAWAAGAMKSLENAAGECSYQPFVDPASSSDKQAPSDCLLFNREPLPRDLLALRRTIEFLPLAKLWEIARTDANVIAVAGGERKITPIYAALKMGICNVLVTDSVCASAIDALCCA